MRKTIQIPTMLAVALVIATIATSPAMAGWRHRARRMQACATAMPTMAVPVATVPMASPQSAASVPATATPDDFLVMLNAARADRGLAPLAYDPGLANYAASNNGHQSLRGLGHHVMADAGQCAAMAWDASMALTSWIGSAAHAAILFDPMARRCGFAVGNGYATANVGR